MKKIVGRKLVEVPTPCIDKAWLIQFEYEEYCQGYEWTWTYLLVYAINFRDACQKVINSCEYRNAREFRNNTLV